MNLPNRVLKLALLIIAFIILIGLLPIILPLLAAVGVTVLVAVFSFIALLAILL